MKELHQYLNALSPIGAEAWLAFRSLFAETHLAKGRYFIEEGQIAKKIGFLVSGVIRAFYRNGEGVEYNKHFFVDGGFVGGYSSLITGGPNQINQQALTDCRLLTATYKDITALYDSHPDLERLARRVTEGYFVEKEQREIEIVLLDADKRYRLFQEQYPQLEQRIPQYHIASYLGVTPTQLSRIRRKFSGR